MALQDLLSLSESKTMKKQGLSEQRLKAQIPAIRDVVSLWREYPDLLVDFWVSTAPEEVQKGSLHLYFYQRVFLRAVMRHRHAYAVFPRAYSKSFLSVLALMLRCILYPGSHLFVTSGGKEQAAGILKEKVDELCKLIPGLKNEIDWTRGKTKTGKDDITIIFKNGSVLDIIAAKQSSRGKRATGGLVEECILVDDTTLNEVIIPTMNVDRLLPDGTRHKEEKVNKSQIYVTTAGWKNSYAYQKHMMTLIEQILDPDESIVLGGSWRVPVMEGLLSNNFVQQLKLDGTYNESSFSREYESEWSGDAENAFFSAEVFDKHRVLNQPEKEFSGRTSKNGYYIVSVDVGRIGCQTEAMVIKVTPQPQGSALKTLVNLYPMNAEHFEDQAIHLKKLYYRYHARKIVVDGNGLGVGLTDYMVKSQVDPLTNDILPAFGVDPDCDKEGVYKKYRSEDCERDAMYIIKADASINTEMYSYMQTQMSSGRVKFLIDERQAKLKLLATKQGQAMDADKRADYLKPFTLTTVLREQLLNLVEENDNNKNIILKQSSRGIQKDKVSALGYGLYYIKQTEDRRKKRHGRDISKMLFMN